MKILKSFKTSWLGPAILSFSVSISAAVQELPGVLHAPVELEIHAQPLGDALNALAEQSGLQVVVFSEVVEQFESRATVGEFESSEAALQYLLAGTGLGYRFVNERTVAIQATTSTTREGAGSGKSRPASSPMLMTQTPTPANQQRRERATSDDAEVEELLNLEEIIVTGTRLRGLNPASPVVVVDRLDIERGGYTLLEDVFRRLPQSFSSINSTSADTFTSFEFGDGLSNNNVLGSPIGASSVNLRGLGSRATLVLVNGRRRTSSAQGVGQFTDISNIPLSKVERIEILTDGATAIYGADAVAGVVNIILRKDYDGGTLQLRHESSSSDADLTRMNAAYTFRIGRGFLTLSGDYSESDSADTTKFIHSGPSGLGDFTDIGGVNNRLPGGQPGIVFESVPDLFGPVPGAPLGIVPSGQDGSSLTLGNLDPLFAATPTVYQVPNIGPEVESSSVRLNGEFDLTRSLVLELETGYTRQENAEFWAPQLSDFTFMAGSQLATPIPESNPINQFGAPVFVGYSFDAEFSQMQLSNEQQQDNYHWGLFLKGNLLFRDWTFNLGASGSREEARSVSLIDGSFFDADGNFSSEAAAARHAPVLNGLNVLTDGSNPSVVATNVILLRTLIDRIVTDSESDARLFDGHVAGLLFDMPAGEAQFALGFQVRQQHYEQTRVGDSITTPVDADQDSVAVFAEFNLPLISDRPFFHQLDLSLAARHERFDLKGQSRVDNSAGVFDSDFFTGESTLLVDLDALYGPGLDAVVGLELPLLQKRSGITPASRSYDSTDPQLRLAWYPTEDLLIRSTWGESYLIPQVQQQFGDSALSDGEAIFSFANPPADLPPGIDYVIFLDGPNSNLAPQEATTFTVGFDYMSSFLRDFSFGVTYGKTDFENYIASPLFDSPLAVLVDEFDVFLGSAFHVSNGVLLFDARQQNLAKRTSETVDVTAEFGFQNRFGDWFLELNAVHTLEVSQQATVASPTVVFSDTELGPSDWAGNLVVNWYRGSFGATSVVNYTSGHRVVQPLSVLFEGNLDPRTSSASYTTWDLQFRYGSQATSGFMRGVAVQFGAQNLLDADFPFVDNRVGFATNRVNTRRRVIYIDLRKDFNF